MKIILDAMGGDNAPKAICEGAIAATQEISEDIILIGQENMVRECLDELGYTGDQIQIVNAEEVITNDEAPVKAVRRKKDSSIVKGLNMVKDGEADVFISAGSTGALLAGGLFILGRIKGIDRPTLATVYPVIGKQPSILVDSGANAECKPNNLLEFGQMGSIYMEKVLGRTNPTVGLVNNGTEEGKGTTLTKAAYELLKGADLNFIGSIEAREVPNGVADVIVTDGFTGNAILKLTEGMGLMVLREMKRRFLQGTKAKLGAMLLKEKLMGIKKEFNYAEYGGAPLLGVQGPLLKMHGSSDALAVKQTIIKALPYVKEDVVGKITEAVLANSKVTEAEEE